MARKGLKGTQLVLKNLNKELKKITRRSMTGLIKAAIIIIRDTENTPPITPVDDGNLRASRYVVTGTGDKGGSFGVFKGEDASKMQSQHTNLQSKQKAKAAGKPLVIIGFSANYAAPVHAMKTAKFKRPNAGGDFLKSSIDSNKDLIIKVVKEDAKIR